MNIGTGLLKTSKLILEITEYGISDKGKLVLKVILHVLHAAHPPNSSGPPSSFYLCLVAEG